MKKQNDESDNLSKEVEDTLDEISNTQKKFIIPEVPPLLDSVESRANIPSDLDAITWELSASANLLNINFAFSIDYSHLGLGKGVFIPTMISRDCAGRRSVLSLPVGDRVLTGVFVANSGIALRYWTRKTGCTVNTQIKDTYKEEWINREGDIVITGLGTVEEVDYSKGSAVLMMDIKLPDINLPPMKCRCTVILWSLICWCSCEPAEVAHS